VSNLLEQDVKWDRAHVREELEAVQDDLTRLNNSIGALLDLSRLEASAWEPKKDIYEFGEILGTAISKIPQKQRGRITYDLPDDLPMICVDFPQWARALQNLLENALSYSPESTTVRVGASYTPTEVRMWVQDEGPGIKPQDKSRIFEKFYRGETSGKVPSGTGLGLAVTKEIVRFHGGKIWVEDVVPQGARMIISLPRDTET
jgi:signal transduction histidine kinase